MIQEVMDKMIEYDKGDPKRIQHFIKVYSFAHMIALKENVDAKTLEILDIASILHDIGIHNCEKKYGKCPGHLQEQEGIAPAQELLVSLKVDESIIERVCYLIGHHHTYMDDAPLDLQILEEADFLVNAFEDNVSVEAIQKASGRLFKTNAGKAYLQMLFLEPRN